MTTASTVSTSTVSTGITWKVLVSADKQTARVKITSSDGRSREVQFLPAVSVDPLTDAVLLAIKNEFLANGSANTQREGTISITAASTVVRLLSDTDYVAF